MTKNIGLTLAQQEELKTIFHNTTNKELSAKYGISPGAIDGYGRKLGLKKSREHKTAVQRANCTFGRSMINKNKDIFDKEISDNWDKDEMWYKFCFGVYDRLAKA